MANVRAFFVAALILFPAIGWGLTCGTLVYNPIAAHLDCTGFPTTGASVGNCVVVTGVNPFTIGFSVCGSTITPTNNFLLVQDGGFFLLQDGGKMILQ